ncbi:MAG: hypothetical protein JSW62_02275 [Thermoplasmatales archaeon]|nr:MAG: hypothetical protein JSW62_02275 [Thermoplasmatales archaeon]
MKENVKKWFDTPYDKYENIARIGITILIIGVVILVLSARADIDLPSWVSMIIVLIPITGMIVTLYAMFNGLRLIKQGKAYDEREKKLLGRAAFYGMLITIIVSPLIIYVTDYLEIELSNRTIILIPICILSISTSILFYYYKKKGDVW